MINQADKAKDMARSILPARWRKKWRKERAFVHREGRRANRENLRSMLRDPESWDDGGEYLDDSTTQVRGVMSCRRSCDKLNHFQRWAVERTKEMPVEARLSHLRSLLPDGLIGQHAMLHLEVNGSLKVEHEHELRWRWWKRPRTSFDPGLIASLLRRAFEVEGGIRGLHLAIKKASEWPNAELPFRPVYGIHDVREFVRWVVTPQNGRVREVVEAYVRELRLSGDAKAAFAVAATWLNVGAVLLRF
ncbi:MAG: hypothetical protein JNM17_18305 [Archangium sp.]|nr:hypothetical protein [Archangium sp.]